MTTIPPPICEGPDLDPLPPGFAVPANACDCHVHVFDEPSEQIEERRYTAPRASLQAYIALQRKLGLTRTVIVQPSVYGTDNRTTMSVVQGRADMKAIVVVGADAPKQQLRELADLGAVGCRVNTLYPSNAQLDDLKRLARSIADLGWHLQLLVDVSEIENLIPLVTGLPLPVVFDHMGHVPATKGVDDPGFQSLLRLLGDGHAWAKISGVYRTTAGQDQAYPDVRPFADALIRTNVDHLVWGSDWPHPDIATPMPNDGHLLNQFAEWAPDEATLKTILVTNPERLYGFV